MDTVRIRHRPRIARGVYSILSIVVLAIAAAFAVPALFAHRSAAEPSVARASLTIDTVTRGPLERGVTAAGVLEPDRVRIVATVTDGIVADVAIRPGTRVGSDTIVARLENPDLAAAVADAAAQLAAANADVRSAREEAASASLDQATILRSARAEDARAAVEASADTALHVQGLVGDLQYRSALIKSGEDHDLVALAHSKISVGAVDADAKIAAAQARVEQFSATLAARRAQLATLVIRAGAAGVVLSVAVDPGQRVTSGSELARIADERSLKAVLQVAESDVRGVVPGLLARIVASDAGTMAGHVSRIAPAAQNGTVAVDVALDHLPQGARSDQNVDGTIVISHVSRTLSLARPAAAADAGTVTLYRLDGDGTHAFRTQVELAPGSDDRSRIRTGLHAGDRAIVSDTSAFDAPIVRIRQ